MEALGPTGESTSTPLTSICKDPFPYKVTFSGSRDWDLIFRGHF